eukprot:gene12738-17110_t
MDKILLLLACLPVAAPLPLPDRAPAPWTFVVTTVAGGFHCAASKTTSQACQNAPGRNLTRIDNCDCGCDVFFMHGAGHRVRVLDDEGLHAVAGSGIRGFRDGPSLEAEFNHPYDVVALP